MSPRLETALVARQRARRALLEHLVLAETGEAPSDPSDALVEALRAEQRVRRLVGIAERASELV